MPRPTHRPLSSVGGEGAAPKRFAAWQRWRRLRAHFWPALVTRHDLAPTGLETRRRLSPAHRSRLLALPRRAATLVERPVLAGSSLVDKTLRDLQLPGGRLVVAVQRGRDTLIPRGNTRLQAGGVLTLAVQRAFEAEVRRVLATTAGV